MYPFGDRQVFTDLTEALLEGGWDFSIEGLQNCFYIFPGSISAQVAGKQAEEVCERTHKHTHTRAQRECQKGVQLYHRKAGLLHGAAVRTIEATMSIMS